MMRMASNKLPPFQYCLLICNYLLKLWAKINLIYNSYLNESFLQEENTFRKHYVCAEKLKNTDLKKEYFFEEKCYSRKKYLKILFSLQMCTKKHTDRIIKKKFTEKITSNKSASMFAFMLMAKSKKRRYFFWVDAKSEKRL